MTSSRASGRSSSEPSRTPRTALDAVNAELARRSLAEFIRAGWHVLEPETPLEWNWHIDAIALHLQAAIEDWIRKKRDPSYVQRIQNLLINVPPGTGKSRIVSVFFPAWVWLHAPEWRAIFLSANPRVALRDADYCRTVLLSDWYQDSFQPSWKLRKDRNALGYFANDAGGFRQAMGITAKITGERGDALVVDDPHDAEEVKSDAERIAVLDRWDTAIANRVNDLRSSLRIGIMQRLHHEDWSGHVLKGGGWEHLCLPMEFEPGRSRTTAIGWTDPRTREGEVLHPARFTPEVLAVEKKRLGSYGIAGQFQQRPVPAEGGILKRSWFRFYTVAPPRFDEVFLSCDLNFQKTERGSYVVIGAFGRLGADLYLLREWRERCDYVRTKVMFREACAAYPMAGAKLVEDKANGPALKSDLSSSIPGILLMPTGKDSKESRAYTASPFIEAGNFYLPHPDLAPWVAGEDGFLDELTNFPNGAADDRVDVTTQAIIYCQNTPLPTSSGFRASRLR